MLNKKHLITFKDFLTFLLHNFGFLSKYAIEVNKSTLLDFRFAKNTSKIFQFFYTFVLAGATLCMVWPFVIHQVFLFLPFFSFF